jgi:hypothetical protein
MRDLLGSAAREIPRPAGKNAGLRDDAVWRMRNLNLDDGRGGVEEVWGTTM